MTTIQDNTSTETAPPARANGIHAAPKTRASKPPPAAAIATDTDTAILTRNSIDAQLIARLEELRSEEARILETLGLSREIVGTVGRSRKAGAGKAIQLNSDMAPMRARGGKAKRAAIAKPARKGPTKARAKRATANEIEAANDTVLKFLNNANIQVSAGEIVQHTSLPKAHVARALKDLVGLKKIKSTGKARGTKYTAK